MKNIIRWTIGNTSKQGLNCLKTSIKNIIKLYEKEFKYYLCYNNIDVNKIKWIYDFPISLVNQEKHLKSLSLIPTNNPCWKLYPPRLDINSYEIFLDNDLILYKKINLNEIINKNIFFISQAIEKSYGSLQNNINLNVNLNSGFFGVPPGFDFQKEIELIIKKFNIEWKNSHFEEQAVVAYIINKNKYELINLEKIYICKDKIKQSDYGLHFVGVNKGNDKFWKTYKMKIL
jgi:hypothetical protein